MTLKRLSCLLLIVTCFFIASCDFLEPKGPTAPLDTVDFVSADPPIGSTIEPNATITVTFDDVPTNVAVTQGAVGIANQRATISGPFEEGPLSLNITWTNGAHRLTYTVIPKNSLPVIRNIYNPDEVIVGHQEVFRVDAHDSDGDKLMYEWSFVIDGRVVVEGRDRVEMIDSGDDVILRLLSGHQGRIIEAVVTVSDGKAAVKRSTKSIPIKRVDPPHVDEEIILTDTMTQRATIEGRRMWPWEIFNEWDPWVRTFTFPGRIVSFTAGHEIEHGDGFIEGNAIRSGNQITLKGHILAKTLPTSTLHVWVKATYVVNER